MSKYFPEPFERSGGNVKVELNLSYYVTEAELKRTAGIDTSILASKTDLASLKTKVDNRDVDKLKTVPADLSKLSNVVDSDVVTNTVYDKLVIKVDATDTKMQSTGRFATKSSMIQSSKVLRKGLKMLKKQYLILVGWSRRLVTRQKLQRSKIRYLVLLN